LNLIISNSGIWASYPADSTDLSDLDLPVYSIYGELDPRANPAAVAERGYLLPIDTVYVEISGGDHHQFGSYLIDPEDHHATISIETQQGQIIRATLDLLARISEIK